MIANETWVTQPNASINANDVVAFSKAIKAVDSTIKVIPNGNTDKWWETILTICSDYIDGICVSNYPINTTDTIYTDLILLLLNDYTNDYIKNKNV
jgi:hypothetical protein